MPVQPYASCSAISAFSSSPMPGPPYSLGTEAFTRPSSCAATNTSFGKRLSRSHSAAIGMMRSLVKRLAVSIRARWSSESPKFNMHLLLGTSTHASHFGAHRPRTESVAERDPNQEHARDENEVCRGHRETELIVARYRLRRQPRSPFPARKSAFRRALADAS